MSRLTANQLRILRRAAEAKGGWILGDEIEPLTAKSLVRRQMLVAKGKGGAPGLAITQAGRAAIGAAATPAASAPPTAESPTAEPPISELAAAKIEACGRSTAGSASGAPTGKLERVVALLRRDGGASLEELQAVTGWQAHSVRGALSGALKKKRRLAVTSEVMAGRRFYRINTVEVAA